MFKIIVCAVEVGRLCVSSLLKDEDDLCPIPQVIALK
jgi:hypothetical protein